MAIKMEDDFPQRAERKEQEYKPRILQILLDKGGMDANQLLGEMVNISPRELEEQLQELEEDQLIVCERKETVPPKVEYVITESGKSMKSLYEMTLEFGKEKREKGYTIVQNLREDGDLF